MALDLRFNGMLHYLPQITWTVAVLINIISISMYPIKLMDCGEAEFYVPGSKFAFGLVNMPQSVIWSKNSRLKPNGFCCQSLTLIKQVSVLIQSWECPRGPDIFNHVVEFTEATKTSRISASCLVFSVQNITHTPPEHQAAPTC